jgi:hypothetical protein
LLKLGSESLTILLFLFTGRVHAALGFAAASVSAEASDEAEFTCPAILSAET